MGINKQQPRISIKPSVIKVIALFCLCCLLTSSCGQGANRSLGSIGDTANNRVTIGTTLKLRTIDPADAYELLSGELLQNLGDTLYTYE